MYRHKKNKTLPEVCDIFGQKGSVTADEYTALYRKYVQRDVTEFGVLLVHPEAAGKTIRKPGQSAAEHCIHASGHIIFLTQYLQY